MKPTAPHKHTAACYPSGVMGRYAKPMCEHAPKPEPQTFTPYTAQEARNVGEKYVELGRAHGEASVARELGALGATLLSYADLVDGFPSRKIATPTPNSPKKKGAA